MSISIYVRNKDITPSSYYRLVQYTKTFQLPYEIHDIAPKKLYQNYLNRNKTNKLSNLVFSLVYYIVMVCRVTVFLLKDMVIQPKYVIVSKTFLPRHTPWLILKLIDYVTARSVFYWDFDDHIFESKEISFQQAQLLEKNAQKIIVTSEYLKNKISPNYHNKVILMPTTDGDLQGFDEAHLQNHRLSSFDQEIRLVWVATASNLPSLERIIPILDLSAQHVLETLKKTLVLTVVCNQPLLGDVKHLKVINITWTRLIAKECIYNAHIGIMPLIHQEYALGKGGFKLVQYLSTGLPVIASSVGFNQRVVNETCGILVQDKDNLEGWEEAIMKCVQTTQHWTTLSQSAYRHWKKEFSFEDNSKVWNRLLSESKE